MKNKQPYQDLKIWETLIDFQLLILTFIGIIALIVLKIGGDQEMLIDILINIGCSVVTSISLSIFIYFKFLKKIPDENRKKIDELLNARLGYETSNHNATLHALNPTNEHLSGEHKDILNILHQVKEKEIAKEGRYQTLSSNKKMVVDSINNLSVFSDILQKVNHENQQLHYEIGKLKEENSYLKNKIAQKQTKKENIRSREYEHERDY